VKAGEDPKAMTGIGKGQRAEISTGPHPPAAATWFSQARRYAPAQELPNGESLEEPRKRGGHEGRFQRGFEGTSVRMV
jgi:hypothetical protein